MLARQLTRSLRSSVRPLLQATTTATTTTRSVSSLSPVLYTAVSSSKGSRASGTASTREGNLSVLMGMPIELGGTKGPTEGLANPEQLFGMAYGTCFLSALAASHGTLSPDLKPLPKATTVRSLVSLGKDAGGAPGFRLAVELEILAGPLRDAGLDEDGMRKLVMAAHELCPYSRAIKGNVEVEIRVVEA